MKRAKPTPKPRNNPHPAPVVREALFEVVDEDGAPFTLSEFVESNSESPDVEDWRRALDALAVGETATLEWLKIRRVPSRAGNPAAELAGDRIEALAQEIARKERISLPDARSRVRAEIQAMRDRASADRRANPRLPRGFRDSLTSEQVDPIHARRQRAKEKFLDALQEAGGLTRAQAETAFESMRKNRMLDMRHASVSEHITVKHGSFLDRDVVRRAAGLRDEESRDLALPLSLSLYPKAWKAAPPPPPPHRPSARRAELPREQCGDCEWCASLDSTDKTRVEDADHAPMAPPASTWEMEHGHPRCEACHGQFYATRNVAMSDAQKAGLEDIRAGRWLCSRHAEGEAETPRRANPVPMEPASSAERRSLLLMDPGSLRSAYKQAERELYAESRAGERDRLSKRACAILWALREKGERSPNPVGKPRRIDAEAALLRTRIESILREYGLEPMADYPTHMNSYANLIIGGRWKGESPSWGPVEVALPSDRARGSDDFSATVVFESAPAEAARLLSPSDVAARGAIPFNGKVWVRERSADAVEKRVREILDRAFAGGRAPNPIAIKQFTY